MPKLVVFIIVTTMLIIVPATPSISASPHIGIVKTPLGANPSHYYQLKRNSKLVSELQPNMKVYNGDEIIPLRSEVMLHYIHTGCGKVNITAPVIVQCSPINRKTAGGFLSFLCDIGTDFFNTKVQRKSLLRTGTVTTRAAKQDISCYPESPFQISPWPTDGATLLVTETILLRWDEFNTPCTEVNLIIAPIGKEPVINRKIKAGALVEIRIKLVPGQRYEWFVCGDNKARSASYFFTVLSEEETNNINAQLKEVGQYHVSEPVLAQALYLQRISDVTSDIDLYPASAQLLKQYWDNGETELPEAFEVLIDNLLYHSF